MIVIIFVEGTGIAESRCGEDTAADAGGGGGELPSVHSGGGCVARDPGGGFFDRQASRVSGNFVVSFTI